MYLVTWHDTHTDEPKSLKLHSIRSVEQILSTFRQQPNRYEHVRYNYVTPGRVREIVIVVK